MIQVMVLMLVAGNGMMTEIRPDMAASDFEVRYLEIMRLTPSNRDSIIGACVSRAANGNRALQAIADAQDGTLDLNGLAHVESLRQLGSLVDLQEAGHSTFICEPALTRAQ